jgi:ABC-type Fe3+ transport system substrate-binding protein
MIFARMGRSALAAALLLYSCLASQTQPAGDWQAGAGEDWNRILAAARREGTVSAIGAPPLATPFAEAFKRDTGIELQYIGANPADIQARISREAKANSITVDVVLSGAGDLTSLLPAGLLNPVRPQLILPNVTEMKNWQGGTLRFADNAGQYMLKGSRYIVGWPVVNADMVKPAEITTWKDLLKPEYKGRIAAFDPRSGGPGQGVAAYLADRFGIDFVKQLYIGQDVRYASNPRQLVDWAARGTHPIIIGSIQSVIEQYRAQGFKLVVLAPQDGPGYLSSGFSVLDQLKGTLPHPNAATVFINWYASRAGQEVYAKAMLEPSARLDVNVESIPDYVKPKAGVDYPDTYSEDWYVKVRPAVSKAVIDALGGR